MTADQFQLNIVLPLANRGCWVRYWMNWMDQSPGVMAIQCRDEDGKPHRISDAEHHGLSLVPNETLFIYTVPRTNADGTPFVSGSEPPTEAITEDWLRSVGFKWHQLERQPSKMWVLWLGDCTRTGISSFEDLGIEVADNQNYPTPGTFTVFLRSDTAHQYSRFIHIRYVHTKAEVIALVEALTGQKWDAANNIYGSMHTPEQAERLRKEAERLDLKWLHESPGKWAEIEKDETRGRALPEHYEAHEKAKGKA